MRRFISILVPLDGSPEAAKVLGCACWLADRLGATLHILNVTPQPLPPGEALDRLHVPGKQRNRMLLHQIEGDAESAVLATLSEHARGLLVMSARGASASLGIDQDKALGRVARAVIERTEVPVLLLPARYREILPWESMMVAASGETSADQALNIAVQLATELGIRVAVAHCIEDRTQSDTPPLGTYADAPHHEHAERLGEILNRGLSSCSHEQSQSVDNVALCLGEPATELAKVARQRGASVIALGWHGALGAGRAPVLKHLLDKAESPILLFKEMPKTQARLKVGDEFNHG